MLPPTRCKFHTDMSPAPTPPWPHPPTMESVLDEAADGPVGARPFPLAEAPLEPAWWCTPLLLGPGEGCWPPAAADDDEPLPCSSPSCKEAIGIGRRLHTFWHTS
jgi:hypothetical protein